MVTKSKNKSKSKSKNKNINRNNKYKKHNKTFKKVRCSTNSSENIFSCFSNNSLFKLKSLWNKRHPDDKILINNSYKLWLFFKDKLLNVCDNEKCWIEQQFAKNNIDSELNHFTFAPQAPLSWKKNKYEWLSSVDIDSIMKQYENKYKCFKFIGPSPINYDDHVIYGQCVWEDLCKFDINNYLKNNISKIGMIFNLDPHYKSGSHWVSLFIDLKKKYIFYFDSVGTKIPLQIKKLVNKIIKQCNKYNIDISFDENSPFEHQKGNTECGMYSLFFITELVKDNKNINDFKTKRFSDDEIHKFRKLYFNFN